MKQLSVILLFLFCLACKEISFHEPQPKGKKALRTVPHKLHGKYVPLKDDGESGKDTIIVSSTGYSFGYFDPAERVNQLSDGGSLGDSLVLKHYKGYYFLSFNENPEWIIRVIKRRKNGDLEYLSFSNTNIDFKKYLEKIALTLPIDSSTVNGETLYQIDPSPKQLLQLIKDGYFSTTILQKVSNDQD